MLLYGNYLYVSHCVNKKKTFDKRMLCHFALVTEDRKPYIKCYEFLICNVMIKRYIKEKTGGRLPANRSCSGTDNVNV